MGRARAWVREESASIAVAEECVEEGEVRFIDAGTLGGAGSSGMRRLRGIVRGGGRASLPKLTREEGEVEVDIIAQGAVRKRAVARVAQGEGGGRGEERVAGEEEERHFNVLHVQRQASSVATRGGEGREVWEERRRRVGVGVLRRTRRAAGEGGGARVQEGRWDILQ